MDNDLDELLDELASEKVASFEPKERAEIVATDITPTNQTNILYQKIGGLVDNLEGVLGEFKERIEEGDTYESTIMGFTQTATTLNSTLNTIQKSIADEQKHLRSLERDKIQHEQKKELIEHRAKHTNKEIGSNNTLTQTNTIIYTGGGGANGILDYLKNEGVDTNDIIGALDV